MSEKILHPCINPISSEEAKKIQEKTYSVFTIKASKLNPTEVDDERASYSTGPIKIELVKHEDQFYLLIDDGHHRYYTSLRDKNPETVLIEVLLLPYAWMALRN